MEQALSHRPVREMIAEAPDAGCFPRRITIEISAACNLSCVMCPRRYASTPGGFMSRTLFEKILGEIASHEVEAIVPFFRGEPLLHPEFTEWMALIREKTSARIQLATNGLLLSPSLSRSLLDLGLDFISFSLDALRKETYEKIRLGGDFETAMENAHTFLKMRKARKNCGTVVQVSATETSLNAQEIHEFIRYWRPLVDRVRIYPRHSENGRFGSLAHPEPCRSGASREPCRKPFTELVIYANGHVALCNHDWDRDALDQIGSIADATIAKIWNNPMYKEIRRIHLNRRWQELQPCRHCDHWQGWGQDQLPAGLLVETLESKEKQGILLGT